MFRYVYALETRSMSDGIEPVLKLTPSLSKYSAKMPCVPLLDSSEQDAEMDASSDALSSILDTGLIAPSKRIARRECWRGCIPVTNTALDHDASSVSKPVLRPQFFPQLPSFEPQEA